MEKAKIVIRDKRSLLLRSWWSRINGWVKEHKIETLLLGMILLLGAFIRLYRIDEYMTFLGDEGRDAIIVRNLLVHGDPILIGPGTSIGNMYLGPLYYYLIAPFLLLANFSPAGPSIMIALFGIATIFLLWKIGKEWFGPIAAFTAAFFFAISPVIIVYNRSSWNPNIMPFFSLLCVYATWRVWEKYEFKWLVAFGISFAFVMQSQYLGLILAPICTLFFVITLWKLYKKDRSLTSTFWRNAIIGLFVFLFLMSPLAIFDARHGWNNFNAIKTFFTVRQDTVSANPLKSIPELWPLWEQVCTRLLGATNTTAGHWIAFGLFDGTVALLLTKWWRKKNIPPAFFLLLVWIGVALLGLGAYKHELYDHYFGFIFAAPFLLLGGITQDVVDSFGKKRMGKMIVYPLLGISLIALAYINFANSPLQYPPNRQLQRSIAVSQKIEDEAGGKKLNLAVIAERNYEGAYQYFLEKDKTGFVKIDPMDTENTIADQLFVVCELPKEKCDPTHNPKAEVANFGWSVIEKEWDVEGITLYKLGHSKQ